MSRSLDKLIAIGLLMALVFTTLAHGAVEPWSIAVFELILIALVALWGIKATVDRRLQMAIPAGAAPLAVMLLFGIAQSVAFTGTAGDRVALSMDVESTRHVVTVALFLTIAFIIASNFLVSRERFFLVANVLTVFGAALAVFAMLPYVSWSGRVFWFRTDMIAGPFVNRDHFAGYMTMLTPIPLAFMLKFAPQGWLAYGFAAALMGTAAVVSGSRSGLIALMVVMIWMALVNRRRSSERKADRSPARRFHSWNFGPITVIVIAIAAGVFWIGATPVIQHFAEAFELLLHTGTPDEGRAAIWRGAINIIRDHPVLGAGLGAFNTIHPTYGARMGFLDVIHAHNDYLQMIAEGGLIAGIIMVWFLVTVLIVIHRGLRSRDPLLSGASLACGAGILAIVVQSFSQNDLQIPAIAMMFLVLVGVVSGIVEKERQLT